MTRRLHAEPPRIPPDVKDADAYRRGWRMVHERFRKRDAVTRNSDGNARRDGHDPGQGRPTLEE
jgi:hypothetical protein